MAERLGEALLDLRTNDTAFNAGIAQAEGRAQKLGSTLDRTSGSSAKLATEMVATGRSAQQLGAGFEQAGQRVVAAAGAQRAGMQQLGFQLGDIATMYSLGARPAQIFASQIGQVTQAVQLMSGGTSKLAAFLGGPWGIALSVATIALAPFIGKLFEADDALQSVEFASSKLGDAQAILGSVIDETTGKVNAQSQAMLALARAQAAAGMVGAMQRQAAARGELQSISQGGLGDLRVSGSMGGVRLERASNGQDVVDLFKSNKLSGAAAEQQLRARMDSGMLTPEAYFRAAQAITSYDVEGANVKVFQDTLAGLDGDSAAARRILGPQKPRGPASDKVREPAPKTRRPRDFDNQSVNLQRQTCRPSSSWRPARRSCQHSAAAARSRARAAHCRDRGQRPRRTAQGRADRAGRGAPGRRRRHRRAGEHHRLGKQRAGRPGHRSRARAGSWAEDEQGLIDERFSGEMDLLRNQMALADTQVAQKVIALRIYDAQVEEERLRLQKIIDLEAIGITSKKEADLARQRLADLNASAASGRKVVELRTKPTSIVISRTSTRRRARSTRRCRAFRSMGSRRSTTG